MTFANFRHTLFTVHMWVGLILGILLAALGLSGSLLVYDQEIANFISAPPRAATVGMPLPLTMIQGSARRFVEDKGMDVGQMQILPPKKQGDVVVVRMGGISPMGAMPGGGRPEGQRREGGARRGTGSGGGIQLYIDPVSGEVLGTRRSVLPPFLTFAHQLHGNFLMSREFGRPLVGWLGVAMCILGLTGLVLWWPRRGQWKYAFKVRAAARGLRFHRELHAATGIWIFLIFMAVSFSGVVIAWPQTMGMNPPGFNPRQMPKVEVQYTKPLGATEAVIAAQAAVPDLKPRLITIPAKPDAPITVGYLSHEAMNAQVLLNPYTGKVLQVRDQSERFLAWMGPVHEGGIGPIWRFLVFLSGLTPLLFVVTGIIMWAKKRKRRIPMNTMTDEVAMTDEDAEE